jgi:hypothetical protein
MNRSLQHLLVGSLVLTAGALVGGCSSSTSRPDAATAAPVERPNSDAASAVQSSEDSTIQEAMAKLSDEERQLAIRQKVCPVSDEPLGSMGTPIKVQVQGRDVFICCSGCADFLKEEPDKYLAKLPPPEGN